MAATRERLSIDVTPEEHRREKAGLKVPSLSTAIIQTVKKKLIRKQLGTIDKKEFSVIDKNIAKALGLAVR